MSGRSVGTDMRAKALSASFTRPANTTAYTAKDAVGTSTTNVLALSGASTGSGQGGEIMGFSMVCSNITVTNKSFRIHFYTAEPSDIADNAVNTVLAANADNYLGYLDSGTHEASGTGGGSYCSVKAAQPIPYRTAAGSTLYAVLEAVGAYTPASAETFGIKVHVHQFN